MNRAPPDKMMTEIHNRRAELYQYLYQVFNGKVQSGPFKDMQIFNKTSWGLGDVGPKVLGCYEEELHSTIEKAIRRQPALVMNIGCAEGYYAVGLARRLPIAKVLAYDTDLKALDICRRTAGINIKNMEDFTAVGECSYQSLSAAAHLVEGRKLIVMDCEGCEMKLLTPGSARLLKEFDLIIECHDFLDRSITPTLQKEFQNTHDLEMVIEGPRDPNKYPLLRQFHNTDRWIIMDEGRPEMIPWLVCWSRVY